MPETYSITEMIEAVQDYLRGKGYKLSPQYDPAFDPARVPVFGYMNGQSEETEIFVDIITEAQIDSEFFFHDKPVNRIAKRGEKPIIPNASSAQFYRHYFPNAQVYWAIPDYVDKKNVSFGLFMGNCRNEYIGLLEVKKSSDGKFMTKELQPIAVSLINQRLDIIDRELGRETNSEAKKSLKENLKEWNQEDLSYLVFYPEPIYLAADISSKDEQRGISKNLVNKISELENLSYKNILVDFSKSYHSKNVSDYDIALEIIKKLWHEYNLKFPTLHKQYESVLQLDPHYRDHFLHAFQVFLFGSYIIDKMYDQLQDRHQSFKAVQGHQIEDAWLIAATYHDYNYMIQNFDEWIKRFFKEALHLTHFKDYVSTPATIDLTEPYIRDGYMVQTKILTEKLGVPVDNLYLQFLYDRILMQKNHGLLSGLSLLTYLDRQINTPFSNEVKATACKAICIHDEDMWQHLAGIAPEKKDKKRDSKIGKLFNKKKILPKLPFDEDPISFLLILSDALQEQGREKNPENVSELDYLYIEHDKCYSGISFKGPASGKFFNSKLEHLAKVKEFLSGKEKFIIKITDDKGRQDHIFRI